MLPLQNGQKLPETFRYAMAFLGVFYLSSWPIVLAWNATWWVAAVLASGIALARIACWYRKRTRQSHVACWVVAHTLQAALFCLGAITFQAQAESDISWYVLASVLSCMAWLFSMAWLYLGLAPPRPATAR